jgi:hypothetical protein
MKLLPSSIDIIDSRHKKSKTYFDGKDPTYIIPILKFYVEQMTSISVSFELALANCCVGSKSR